jgi:hypothetical protein
MAHKKEDKKPPKSSTSKSSSLAGLRMVSTTLEENQSNIKDYFDRFLEQVHTDVVCATSLELEWAPCQVYHILGLVQNCMF